MKFYYIFHFQQNMTLYSPQIIKTLQDQVQNLSPLRDSFRKLEAYYHQLNQDFAQLIRQTDSSEKELYANLKYLEEIHRSLDREFGLCGDDLRQLDCEHARMQMENHQLTSQADALKSRQLLEVQAKNTLENKRKDLIEQNDKLSFTIGKYKQMVHNLQLAIKSKEYENLDIQREIKKLELVNQKLTQLNRQAEANIDTVQQQNEEAVEQIYQLEAKLSTYDRLIEAKERQNKESAQNIIDKTEQLEQLKHRKQYIDKLIQSQLLEQKELIKTSGELQSILATKRDKLMFVEQENRQYQNLIAQERQKKNKSKEELAKLQIYLQTLVSTNEDLFHQLEKSCSQDRDIQVKLSEKLEKLLLINDQIVENDILNKYEASYTANHRMFQQKNARSPPKELASIHSKIMNRSSTPKGQGSLIDKLSFTRTQEMGSTWGTRSKQNLYDV